MTTDTDTSTPTDQDGPPTTIEYPGDTSDQEIKLDLADRVSSTAAIEDVEAVSIEEQDDGTQVAEVTWSLADGETIIPESSTSEAESSEDEDEDNADPEPAPDQADDEADAAGDEEASSSGESAPARTDMSLPKTFEAAIEVGVLQDVLAPVDALVEDCRIHVDQEGLHIRVVDPAQVAMTDLELSTAAFTAYDAAEGTLRLKLNRLLDALGMGTSDELVQFSFDAERGKLTVSLDGLEYTMALIDPASIRSEPDIPDLDLPAALTCEPAPLKRTVTAADMVSDHVRFAVDTDEELFCAEASGDTDEVRLKWASDDLMAFSPGEADSLFALEYLKDLVGAMPRQADIGLMLGADVPCVLSYTIADGAADVECMLAPRLRDD